MKTKNFLTGFALIAASVVLLKCNEYLPKPEHEEELLPISFTVDFAKEVIGFRSSETINLDYFLYFVYKTETGDLYKRLSFANFNGALNDSLPEGNYTFVFVGSNTDASLKDYIPSGTNIKNFLGSVGPSFTLSPLININKDAFYKKINYSIEKGQLNNNSIALDRIVGKIEVVFQDVIPSEVKTIAVNVKSLPNSYLYSLSGDFTTGGGGLENFNISESDRAASGYTFYFVGFENINKDTSRYPVSIEIKAYKNIPDGIVDKEPFVIFSKVINNVDILKNKTVRYSGNMFDSGASQSENLQSSFDVEIEDVWGETIDIPF